MSKNLRILSLFHNGFTGTLPNGYFNGLVNLHYISLGDNLFNGRVPSSLFTLPSLQEARLSNNGFDGPLGEFPNATCSKLQFIDFSSNNLQGPIPYSLFHLGKLRFLQLSSNKFSGTIRLDTISMLRNLHTLGLSHNNLSVDTNLSDDHGLSSFPSLRYLLLGSCKLMEFPRFLRNQTQLIALDLSNNQIHGIIPNWVWRFDYLVYLNLSSNFLSFLEEPFANPNNSTLFIIDLHSNQLSGSIPIVSRYSAHLDFSNNNFSIIPPTLDIHMPFLYVLSLSNNKLDGEIHKSFCNLYFLQRLDLSHNSFNGFIPECLIRKSNTLKVLNLAGNMLIGPISDTIPSSCNLRFLDLNANLLNGTIPKSLANCQRLEVINLGNNLLRDTFPCFLRNTSALRVLVLRSNKLHGSIACPQSNRNWEMLRIVDLAFNEFSGKLPSSLGNLTQLESLDLSYNSLNGEIPGEITSLSFLSNLNLSYNHLVGKIPTGTQIQSFETDSFIGNEGLCGPPLTNNCMDGGSQGLSPPSKSGGKLSSIEWNFLSVELGFTFGLGLVIHPILFFKSWRMWYSKHVDELLYRIIPQLDFVYEYRGGKNYRRLGWKPS